jgi:hypothetical protein
VKLAAVRGFPRYLDIISPATWLTTELPRLDRSAKPDMVYHIELERREWMSASPPYILLHYVAVRTTASRLAQSNYFTHQTPDQQYAGSSISDYTKGAIPSLRVSHPHCLRLSGAVVVSFCGFPDTLILAALQSGRSMK